MENEGKLRKEEVQTEIRTLISTMELGERDQMLLEANVEDLADLAAVGNITISDIPGEFISSGLDFIHAKSTEAFRKAVSECTEMYFGNVFVSPAQFYLHAWLTEVDVGSVHSTLAEVYRICLTEQYQSITNGDATADPFNIVAAGASCTAELAFKECKNLYSNLECVASKIPRITELQNKEQNQKVEEEFKKIKHLLIKQCLKGSAFIKIPEIEISEELRDFLVKHSFLVCKGAVIAMTGQSSKVFSCEKDLLELDSFYGPDYWSAAKWCRSVLIPNLIEDAAVNLQKQLKCVRMMDKNIKIKKQKTMTNCYDLFFNILNEKGFKVIEDSEEDFIIAW